MPSCTVATALFAAIWASSVTPAGAWNRPVVRAAEQVEEWYASGLHPDQETVYLLPS